MTSALPVELSDLRLRQTIGDHRDDSFSGLDGSAGSEIRARYACENNPACLFSRPPPLDSHRMRNLIFLAALLPGLVLAAPPSKEELEKFRASMEAKASVDRESLPGAAVYRARCQMCHEGQAPKAP